MKIKLHTAERTIKLRDSKQSAEHLFRRLNIRRLVKSARESPDTQTVEADAAETTVSLTPIVLQRAAPLRRIQQLRRSAGKSRTETSTPDTSSEQSTGDQVQPQQDNIPLETNPRAIPQGNTPASQEFSGNESHIRATQVSGPKINSATNTSIRDADTTIHPKQSVHTVKQADKIYPRKGTSHLQQIHARRTAAATADAVKKYSKKERVASTIKNFFRGTVKSIGKLSALLFGGAVGLLAPMIIVLVLGGILCSPMAIFFSGETDSELTLQSVIAQLNKEFSDRISEIETAVPHDDIQQTGQRAVWKQILTVYAVKVSTDPETPLDAATMDEQHADVLRTVFWDMNTIDHHTESYTEEESVTVTDDEGNEAEETQTVERTRLIITISSKTAEQIAQEYGLSKEQLGYITELLSNEYDELWLELPHGGSSDDIVQVALSQVGNVGGQPYWSWYGFPSRVEWCACFVSWCGNECGYVDSGAMPKFSYCPTGVDWFKGRGQWQDRGYIPEPGTIIFFDYGGDEESDHVGIVERCDGVYVYTVEGNATGDMCKQNSYSVEYSGIMGYGLLQH